MFPFIIKSPVQSGWSPSKNRTGASRIQVKQVSVLLVGQRMGVHHPCEGFIKESGGGILSVGTLKAFSHPACLFIVGSHRSGIAWGSLTNWHLPLCLWPEGSGEERRPGEFKKSVPFSPTFCRVSFPWELCSSAWGGRGWGHLLFRPVICCLEESEQVLGCGGCSTVEAGRRASASPTPPLPFTCVLQWALYRD